MVKRKIQPRCKHGKRLPKSAVIHELVYHVIKTIARDEKKSISYVLHEMISYCIGYDIMGDKKNVKEFRKRA